MSRRWQACSASEKKPLAGLVRHSASGIAAKNPASRSGMAASEASSREKSAPSFLSAPFGGVAAVLHMSSLLSHRARRFARDGSASPDDSRPSLLVERDVSEVALGDEDAAAPRLVAADRPGLDAHGDRGPPDADEVGVDAHHVADIDRLLEGHGVDRDGGDPALGDAVGEDAARDVHLAEHPAAEDVAVLIGVGGHRKRANREFAPRL